MLRFIRFLSLVVAGLLMAMLLASMFWQFDFDLLVFSLVTGRHGFTLWVGDTWITPAFRLFPASPQISWTYYLAPMQFTRAGGLLGISVSWIFLAAVFSLVAGIAHRRLRKRQKRGFPIDGASF